MGAGYERRRRKSGGRDSKRFLKERNRESVDVPIVSFSANYSTCEILTLFLSTVSPLSLLSLLSFSPLFLALALALSYDSIFLNLAFFLSCWLLLSCFLLLFLSFFLSFFLSSSLCSFTFSV